MTPQALDEIGFKIKENRASEIRKEMSELANEYWELVHKPAAFSPEEHHLPVSGKVFDAKSS